MKNGETVAAFEREFAAYLGAKYAIALCNGTATLHTALVALGVTPGDRVAVPPLTMSATTIAVLHAGAVPVFVDVDPRTWLIGDRGHPDYESPFVSIGVSLYGLHYPCDTWRWAIDDAAQTLRPHNDGAMFTSYSFQASKILSTGEGGMLVTNDDELATRAREFSSLGYRMSADQPRIDPAVLKSPTYSRHHSLGYNYRMNDLTAAEGLAWLAEEPGYDRPYIGRVLTNRRFAAEMYRSVITGDWLTPQHVPDGWTHDYWTFAVACDTPDRASRLSDAAVTHGGERPYPAWRLTYQEPAFRHLAPDGTCPVAESLQPRLLQFQTNDLGSAERNAVALRKAIEALS